MEMPVMSPWLFVYGTLRAAIDHPMHRELSRRARYAGMARLPGRLYDLGPYPGAVPDPHGRHEVLGELYEMHDPAALLPVLDEYEGATTAGERPGEYRRELCPVTLADGSTRRAWVYLLNQPPPGARLIENGDYANPG